MVGVGGPPGNRHAVGIRCPDERKKAFLDFCSHLSDGFPIEAWYYLNGDHHCCWRTMLSYINDQYTSEFQTHLKSYALIAGYKKWFTKGVKLSDGEIKGNPSPQTYALIMRNMYGWDKDQQKNKADSSQMEQLAGFFAKAFESALPSKDTKDSNSHSD